MNPKFKAILTGMARDGLRPDPLLDWDRLNGLAAACADLLNPPPTPDEDALLHPVIRAGNAVLYRLSIGARWFLAERVSGWIATDDPLWLASIAYVCAHAREPEVLWRCSNRAALVGETVAWVRGVSATVEELDRAVAEILTPKRAGAADPAPVEAGEPPRKPVGGAILERVASEYGIAPEDALWRRQEAEIAVLARELGERKAVEAGGASDPDSPRIRALIAVQRAEAALREAVRLRSTAKTAKPDGEIPSPDKRVAVGVRAGAPVGGVSIRGANENAEKPSDRVSENDGGAQRAVSRPGVSGVSREHRAPCPVPAHNQADAGKQEPEENTIKPVQGGAHHGRIV